MSANSHGAAAMPFVSITRLRVRALRFAPGFAVRTFQSAFQAKAAAGNTHVLLLRDAKLTFWTITTWESEAAMRSFMVAGAHRKAMHSLLEWCDEAALAHWTDDTGTPPNWSEGPGLIKTRGRTSKVKYPSPAHIAFEITPPLVSVSRELRFK